MISGNLGTKFGDWTIWRAHPSGRGWAIAASVAILFIFIEPFLIPMHPVLDHNPIALVLGLVGIAAFMWPDRNHTPPYTHNS
jgi:hypothetical protein